ncbi:hypothetical protein EAE96_006532 [Botrytis aclada]|nr:hypothetical protein EAE96_006532 [Botrytis aclada]
MVYITSHLAFLASTALVSAAPGSAPAALDARADCTFTTAATAIASKTTCTTIILNGIVVPAGTTLDLTGLKTGTKVIFQGTTIFGYSEWEGPLVSISGQDIVVTGASGNKLDGGGARWWDGLDSTFLQERAKLSLSSSPLTNWLDLPVSLV